MKKKIKKLKMKVLKNKKVKKILTIRKKKKSFPLVDFIGIVLLAMILAFWGGFLIPDNNELLEGENITSISETNYEKFVEAMEILENKYYEEVSEDFLIDAAIDGMFYSLDDYTDYMGIEELEDFYERLLGDYEGIGCEISSIDGYVMVVNPFSNTPASNAGLIYGDLILSVDGTSAVGMSADEASSIIKGESGTDVVLEIQRGEEVFFVTITRGNIEIPSVHSEIYDNTGYIKIDIFSAITYLQFREELEALEAKGIESLVIDVRGNSGGYLEVVVDMISMFLPKGEIVYKTSLRDKIDAFYSETSEERNYDIAILTNGNSASASEILSISLKESYGAVLVGEKTFGKGTVQETHYLDDGSMIKYTTKKWLSPSGLWANDTEGFEPDYFVELSDLYYENPTVENDNQLQKALDLLK